MEFNKTELILMSFVASLIAVIIVLIGYAGVKGETGCWGGCEPECSTKQCAASIDIKRYELGGEAYDTFHEVPAPNTLLLLGAGVAIMLKMKA